ncbi:protein RRP6-like 2 [Vigna unguiculata]|uniref:Exosome complex exonuclease RRP6 n=1 Tax=Vigna unguiculata TaxID=3917 RepID=A0A4D6M988_VIGUN|nr:protein RRP6-like 2 [Vigna unguiculata]QCD97383.1 exosome complex exonuclease RRP6 [Vigna unguiculata]
MDFDHQLTELSASSPCIPSGEDFHFYYKFTEFRRPIEEIARRTQSMLNRIGSAENIWGRGSVFPADVDDAYEWLVTANDDVFELVDELVDELRRIMKEEGVDFENDLEEKTKVPFHIPTIKKPQYAYNIVVDNANQPFEHVLLEKSEDGQRFIHPLEKFSVLDFVDKENIEDLVPIKPLSIECTPFKLVEEVKGLKELAATLSAVNEFAVDLEHNHYRSFQGLTCLMQISTRTEDFVIDTLKVRNNVGPYLREVFKDPTKKKVLHGADRDILWLQRDFGIYVCNMFDTGQASRVLKLERYSLQHLLQHFCGVTANKEYQNADWRLRPLPDVMLRYGREDTHYLLYIYDLMRIKLFTLSKESEGCDNPLLEVYKRSYDICMQLYEKDLLTENSYLHLYGLRGAGFNAQQLAVVSGLWEWRDGLARADDEGPGYVLPNRIILEIAKQMPVIISNLRRIVGRSKLPYVERSLDVIVNIVRHSMQNAVAFEEAALRLKEERAASLSNVVPVKDVTVPQTPNLKVGCAATESIGVENDTCIDISENCMFSSVLEEECFQHEDKDGQGKVISNCLTSDFLSASPTIPEKPQDAANVIALSTAKGNGEVLKLPTGAIDAPLLGYSMSEWKAGPNKKVKLEQIKPSDNLPSLFALDNSKKSKLVVASEKSDPQKKPVSGSVSSSSPVGVVTVMSDSDSEDTLQLKNSNNHPGKNSLVPRKRR